MSETENQLGVEGQSNRGVGEDNEGASGLRSASAAGSSKEVDKGSNAGAASNIVSLA